MVINKIFKEAQSLVGNHLAEQLEGYMGSDQNKLDPKFQPKPPVKKSRTDPKEFQSQEVSRAQIQDQ